MLAVAWRRPGSVGDPLPWGPALNDALWGRELSGFPPVCHPKLNVTPGMLISIDQSPPNYLRVIAWHEQPPSTGVSQLGTDADAFTVPLLIP